MNDPLGGQPGEPSNPLAGASGSKRAALLASPAPSTLPVPEEPPEILPRVLFIDDEKVLTENALGIWRSTKLRKHARLDTFVYSVQKECELDSLLRDSLDQRDPFTAIYVDLSLRGAGRDAGLGLIGRLRHREPRLKYTPFVAVTSFPDYGTERTARESGAIRFMIKTDTNQATGVLGGFVHRMIMEANETLEQCEDQLWADASSFLAGKLRTLNWRKACELTLDFIHENFVADAVFARKDDGKGELFLIHSKDNLSLNLPRLKISGVPFIRDFFRSEDSPPFELISNLTRQQIGSELPERLVSMRAMLARISLGPNSLGLLSVYRHRNAHRFRKRDGMGLSQIALQLGTSILAEEETRRLRQRQEEIIGILRALEHAEKGLEIYERLQNTLFQQIGRTAKGGESELTASVHMISPGTNLAERALRSQGFAASEDAERLSLENTEGSSVARAVWGGKTEYTPNCHASAEERRRHFLVSEKITSSLVIPLMAGELCLGISALESTQQDAFSAEDRSFAELLCFTAAEALLRVRSRRFLIRIIGLMESLTVSGNTSVDEYIDQIVTLLFDFTRCSEILHLIQDISNVDGPWIIKDVYKFNSTVLDPGETIKENLSFAQQWTRTYIRHVLQGSKTADYTDDPELIPVNDIGFAGRKRGAKTRTQAVIRVRWQTDSATALIISPLFQHRHAINQQQVELLEKIGRVLGSLLAEGHAFRHMFGLASVRDQEARLGQTYGQFRHGLLGQIAKLRSFFEYGAAEIYDATTILNKAKPILTEIEDDICRNRAIVKAPERQSVDLGGLWSKVATDLEAVATNQHGAIASDQLQGERVSSDPEILGAILFNLVDNALRHGGNGVEVRAHATRADQSVEIRVSDNGKGISDNMKKQLFTPGVTSSPASTGMGLYLSQARARDLGGDLLLERSDKNRTIFLLKLPGGRE